VPIIMRDRRRGTGNGGHDVCDEGNLWIIKGTILAILLSVVAITILRVYSIEVPSEYWMFLGTLAGGLMSHLNNERKQQNTGNTVSGNVDKVTMEAPAVAAPGGAGQPAGDAPQVIQGGADGH
jgi:hypothetical protein